MGKLKGYAAIKSNEDTTARANKEKTNIRRSELCKRIRPTMKRLKKNQGRGRPKSESHERRHAECTSAPRSPKKHDWSSH
jgi:hypothetical protein